MLNTHVPRVSVSVLPGRWGSSWRWIWARHPEDCPPLLLYWCPESLMGPETHTNTSSVEKHCTKQCMGKKQSSLCQIYFLSMWTGLKTESVQPTFVNSTVLTSLSSTAKQERKRWKVKNQEWMIMFSCFTGWTDVCSYIRVFSLRLPVKLQSWSEEWFYRCPSHLSENTEIFHTSEHKHTKHTLHDSNSSNFVLSVVE